jgi:uncharacterized protein
MRPFRQMVLAAALLLAPSLPASAQDAKPAERMITVTGVASAAAAPDRASITTGVLTDAKSARDALTRNSVAMKKLLDGLKALGIEPKDIQTAAVQINPAYSEGTPRPQIIGYQAVNQVVIIVRDMKRLGEVLDQAITLGANQMNGIAFEVSNADTLVDTARKAAVADARRKAELFATAAGASLGGVLSISEHQSAPQPYVAQAQRTRAMKVDVPVEGGSVDLQAQVTVVWALR